MSSTNASSSNILTTIIDGIKWSFYLSIHENIQKTTATSLLNNDILGVFFCKTVIHILHFSPEVLTNIPHIWKHK